jgi:hypothetical protein
MIEKGIFKPKSHQSGQNFQKKKPQAGIESIFSLQAIRSVTTVKNEPI